MTGGRTPRAVVAGFDDAPHARPAVLWAAGEAARRGLALVLVHAVESMAAAPAGRGASGRGDRLPRDPGALLDDAAEEVRRARPGLRVTSVVVPGSPADALLDRAGDAAVVVVGTHGRGGFTGLLLGSVSLKVAAHAPCPVVVARGDVRRDPAREVVVAVQDERDQEAVRFALASARQRHGAGVRVVHAWHPLADTGLLVPLDTDLEDTEREQRRLISGALGPVGEYPAVPLETELVSGSAASAVVDASAHASLVVVGGHHRRGGRFGPRLGSVAHAALHHAQCPVAVVPVA